jgi:predicted RNA-binding Zn-ribbon protein involved in translation (DUF1610 family)
MFNRSRTQEVFGYDIDPDVKRRTKSDFLTAGAISKKDMVVVDNCPGCGIERHIKLRQSRKNTLCSKCFHSTPQMQEAKRNQKKEKSEETKQRMRDSHWAKRGLPSAFKGKRHSDESKEVLKQAAHAQWNKLSEAERQLMSIKNSCGQRGLSADQFDGFTSSEGARLRQSAEGKAWSYDVLAKSNFTCEKCGMRGGKLHAHHKNAFAAFPDQRLDVENGACLCEECHDEFHSIYGKGENTDEQFTAWIDSVQRATLQSP